MGFFKKIGKALKKATKQISFKNLVKVGGMIDPSGMVAGMQDAHYMKKDAKNEEDRARAEQLAMQSGQAGMEYAQNRGLFGSALTGAGGSVGSTLIDSSIMTYLKNNWGKVLIGVSVLGAVIFFAVRRGGNARARRR